MEQGYLYVATGEKYLREVQISAQSLRRFTKFPIALVTNEKDFSSPLFDIVVQEEGLYNNYGTKILGLQRTPFSSKTVFLDTDTFVADSIDGIFEFLDYFKMAMTQDLSGHSYGFIQKGTPDFHIKMEKVLHEFHTGVIGYRSHDEEVTRFLQHWKEVHEPSGWRSDMPAFREAFIDQPLSIGILPQEYNFYGSGTFAVAYNKIRVLHERIGSVWNDRRSFVPEFEVMDRYLQKLNRRTCKRVIVPVIGVVPYFMSPAVIRGRLKRMFGVKMSSKMRSNVTAKKPK